MTLLSACQDAADEVGVLRPTVLVGASDEDARRILAFANRTGLELAKVHDWTRLIRVHTFTTVAGQEEYALPDDYDHMIGDTIWDVSSIEPFQGPITAQLWQTLKNGALGAGLANRRFRLRRSTTSTAKRFYVDPTPGETGDELLYEYVSNEWVIAADGTTTRTRFAADTDDTIYPEYLITMGVVWRLLRQIGQAYTTELAEYERARDREIGRDGATAEALSLVPLTGGVRLISNYNVPDTGFG